MLYPAPYGALTQLWAGTTDEGKRLGGKVRLCFFIHACNIFSIISHMCCETDWYRRRSTLSRGRASGRQTPPRWMKLRQGRCGHGVRSRWRVCEYCRCGTSVGVESIAHCCVAALLMFVPSLQVTRRTRIRKRNSKLEKIITFLRERNTTRN